MNQDRKLAWVFVVLCIAGMIFLITTFVESLFVAGRFDEMIRGIGVEILGAIITALGVIGLERMFTDPDPQIDAMSKQITEQHAMIETLRTQVQELHAHLLPKSETPDTNEEA